MICQECSLIDCVCEQTARRAFPTPPNDGLDSPMHHSVSALLPYFEFKHLPRHLQDVSKPYYDLAHTMSSGDLGQAGPELTVALRYLLISKDSAVRAAL